jgi:sortase (surface protein transpeptidase)
VKTPRFLRKRTLRHRRPSPAVPLHIGAKRRPRLLPAAPLLSAIVTTTVVTLIASALQASGSGDPPAGKALPKGALADEHGGPLPGSSRASNTPQRRLVDLVDSQAPVPRRINIPAVGVSAGVIPLGVTGDHSMETPKNYGETGWYKPGPEPGERGAAVIVGHVDSKGGAAVFYRLRELHRGDLIRITRADGSVARFRVEGLERWPKSEFPASRVFRRTGASALRLVTCSGAFDKSTGHYVDNTIVYAARVPVSRRVLYVSRNPQRHPLP